MGKGDELPLVEGSEEGPDPVLPKGFGLEEVVAAEEEEIEEEEGVELDVEDIVVAVEEGRGELELDVELKEELFAPPPCPAI